MVADRDQLVTILRNRRYPSLVISTATYIGIEHNASSGPAFQEGLALLLDRVLGAPVAGGCYRVGRSREWLERSSAFRHGTAARVPLERARSRRSRGRRGARPPRSRRVLKLRGLKYDPISEERLPARARARIEALVAGRTSYVVHSPTLGWTLKPGGATELYRASAQGLQAERDYAATPPPGILRIAAFGDSFTHADDVSNAGGLWTRQLEALDPRLEALNFGVPGYAPDQALLRYRRRDGASSRKSCCSA